MLLKNGAIAKQRLINYLGKLLLERNYVPLSSPHIGNIALFKKSGHYPFYKDSMFPIIRQPSEETGDYSEFCLKPMNCPFHIMAYQNMGVVSYKELPIKFYEFGQVYRYEDSGAINGLYRLRSFTQDDGHIFCSMNQIREIVDECIDLIKLICDKFRLKLAIKYSKRDLAISEKYIGSLDSWAAAQDILKAVCFAKFGNDYVEDAGGAAFYGPKIDFVAKDKLNREWQLGTIQLDFNLPEQFGLNYIGSDNLEVPVLIHRALLGSLERFLGILLDNNLLPMALQPFNMGVIWLGENRDYYNRVVNRLKQLEVYPTVIEHPRNLSEAMAKLYSKGLSNIAIIGKREESHQMVNFNKEHFCISAYFEEVEKLFQL